MGKPPEALETERFRGLGQPPAGRYRRTGEGRERVGEMLALLRLIVDAVRLASELAERLETRRKVKRARHRRTR